MEQSLKTPEQLLVFKPLKQVLAAKTPGAHAVAPNTPVFAALQLMADKGIGFLIVLDGEKLVGVLSERDYARKVVLQGKASKDTLVQDIMTRNVVSVGRAPDPPRCLQPYFAWLLHSPRVVDNCDSRNSAHYYRPPRCRRAKRTARVRKIMSKLSTFSVYIPMNRRATDY